MSARTVSNVTPFDFRSDFTVPEPEKPASDDRISISVSELAALLDQTRESTAQMLRDEQVQIQAEAMKSSAETLKSALMQIVQLAQTLESAALSEDVRADALSQVRNIASELIDGQGNLFHSLEDD